LLRLYWQIGKDIVEKQAQAKWGDGFLQTLSADLCKEFPTMKGFSYRNLKSIRQWYLFYNQLDIIGKQVVSQLEVSLFSVPWGHHLMIMQRCKDIQEAIFYVYKTIENHWSRSVLEHQMGLNLYERQGKAITNFQQQLPIATSDLAQELTKDPYVFDFLSITEKDIHNFGSVYLNSKEKFQKYLDNNKNLLSIKKLRNNIELDAEDLKELKQLLYSNEEVDLESLKTENNSEIEKISSIYGKNESFGIARYLFYFILFRMRSLISRSTSSGERLSEIIDLIHTQMMNVTMVMPAPANHFSSSRSIEHCSIKIIAATMGIAKSNQSAPEDSL